MSRKTPLEFYRFKSETLFLLLLAYRVESNRIEDRTKQDLKCESGEQKFDRTKLNRDEPNCARLDDLSLRFRSS